MNYSYVHAHHWEMVTPRFYCGRHYQVTRSHERDHKSVLITLRSRYRCSKTVHGAQFRWVFESSRGLQRYRKSWPVEVVAFKRRTYIVTVSQYSVLSAFRDKGSRLLVALNFLFFLFFKLSWILTFTKDKPPTVSHQQQPTKDEINVPIALSAFRNKGSRLLVA